MESDDRIQIRISEDGLEAWVAVAEGSPLEPAALEEQLDTAGITNGIQHEAIDAIARALTLESKLVQDICVARGLPPEPGTPPALQLSDPSGPIAGLMLEDGRIDFRERLLILPVGRRGRFRRLHHSGSRGQARNGCPG